VLEDLLRHIRWRGDSHAGLDAWRNGDDPPLPPTIRTQGFSQAQAIKATVERVGVSLAEAKSIVHLSPVGEDMRPANDRLHQSLDEAAGSGP